MNPFKPWLSLLILIFSVSLCPAASEPQSEKSKSTPHSPAFPKKLECRASWYGGRAHGGPTASGEKFNQYALTAAHKTLPFHSRVRVTNLANGKSVIVRINDRGPFIRGREIDISYAAAKKIGMLNQGVTRVKIEML
ncbi:MAG: septal ring lytic transglycosylase RlpA family protein [Candidatus Methylacidiphilales bacterium]|nr:septal ring lytic transglycosylase RlpA family protein [Candidatus Methylacidiphilales bacterium]